MNSNIEQFKNKIGSLCQAVEEKLESWDEDSNLQVPNLMKMLALHFSWDEKNTKRMDQVVRNYIHDHPEWEISRGVKGGITRKIIKQNKIADKEAKLKAKEDAKKELIAKINDASSVNPSDDDSSIID